VLTDDPIPVNLIVTFAWIDLPIRRSEACRLTGAKQPMSCGDLGVKLAADSLR